MNFRILYCSSLIFCFSSPAMAQMICECSGLSDVQRVESSKACTTKIVSPGEEFWIICRSPQIDVSSLGLVLKLGRVADDDETYFNGKLVGSSRTDNKISSWNYFLSRSYFVPQELFKKSGQNEIKIKVTSITGGNSGLVDGLPSLQTSIQSSMPKVSELGPAIFLLFVVFVFSLFKTSTDLGFKLKSKFVVGGILTSALLLLNSFYFYRAFPNWANLSFKIHIVLTVVTVYVLYRFSEILMNIPRSTFIRAVTTLVCIAAIIFPSVGLEMHHTRSLSIIFAFWGVPAIFYGSTLISRAARSILRGEEKVVIPFLIGSTALIVFGGWDLFELYQGRLPVYIPLSGIGFSIAFFMAAVSFALVDRSLMESSLAIEAEIGRIVRQVAHDIRSPLTVLNITRSGPWNDEKSKLMGEAIQRIHKIADDLLTKSTGETKDFIVDQSTEAVIRHFKTSNSEINFHFDNLLTPGLQVRGNQTDFERILTNILDNSVQAMSGGRIIVRCVRERDETVLIEIVDSGKGIPKNVLHRIGEKNFSFGKHDRNSSGLGLYSAKTLLQKWGGSFSIDSIVNVGTTVKIRIPISIT